MTILTNLSDEISRRSTINIRREARNFKLPAPPIGKEVYEFEIGQNVISTGTGRLIAGCKTVVTDRYITNTGFVRYLAGNMWHQKGDLITDPNAEKPAKKKRNTKIKTKLPKGHVNPTKTHYNKLVKRHGAWQITNTTDVFCNVLVSTAKNARTQRTFTTHYPTELGIAYGLKHKLIKISRTKVAEGKPNPVKYHNIYFTEAGLKANLVCIPKGLR